MMNVAIIFFLKMFHRMSLIEQYDVTLGEYKALNEENQEFLLILKRLATLEAIEPPYQYSVKVLDLQHLVVL